MPWALRVTGFKKRIFPIVRGERASVSRLAPAQAGDARDRPHRIKKIPSNECLRNDGGSDRPPPGWLAAQ